MSIAAIIVAAGRGTRAGGDIPKQYQDLGGVPVLARAVRAFAGHLAIDHCVVVLHQDDDALFSRLILPHLDDLAVQTVPGGATRGQSVQAGLAALDGSIINKVLIHDGARPLVSAALIDRIIAALDADPAAAPALPMTDALWRVQDGLVQRAVNRDGIYRAQTPQGFALKAILVAYDKPPADAADDVAVARQHGLSVAMVPGDANNIKITHPADFTRAEQLVQRRMDIRCGNGFDVHAFVAGDNVTLCGITLAHNRALKGHSDADVAMHALTDAVYGALADGDIGQHFPPSDARWRGAASDIFLRHAVKQANDRGFEISNMDCTIICEAPKIGPHVGHMRANLAQITGVAANRISIKATTTERLGFAGRKEGIAASATVTLIQR